MFDLICGTSTGGVLAVLIGLRRLDAKRCDAIYKGASYFLSRLKLFSDIV